MSQGRSLLKKIVLLDLVIVVYVVFSSAVIDYRSEQKVTSVLVDQVMEWNYRHFGVHKQIIEREKRLSVAMDEKIIGRLKGRIVLQIEQSGEMWYLYPMDFRRYYIGKARDVWGLIDKFGKVISSEDFIEYNFFTEFPDELKGYFVTVNAETEENYYIDPVTAKAIELKTVEDAWATLKALGLGVKNEDIRKVPVGEL